MKWLARLLAYEWWALLLILPAVLLVNSTRVWVLALIPLFWLVRGVVHGRLVPLTPLNGPLWLLLAMVAVSLWATYDVQNSLGKVAGLVWGIAFFWATADFYSRSRLHLWLGVLLLFLFGWGVVGLGLIGTQWTQKFALLQPYLARLPSLLPLGTELFNPNQVAGVLLWVAPVALATAVATLTHGRALRQQMPAWLRWPFLGLAWLTAVATTAVLVLTQSRGGLAGLAMGVGVMLYAVVRRPWRNWLLGGGGVAGTAVLLALWQMADLRQQLLDAVGLSLDPSTVDNLGTLNGRLEIWSRALYAIQDFPITGMGMNNFRVLVHVLYPLFTIPPTVDIAHAHNQFLQAALDLGLPGAIAYVALWLVASGMVWRVVQASTGDAKRVWDRTLALGFAGLLAASFFYGLFDAVTLGAKPGFIWWFALGLLAALHHHACRPPDQHGRHLPPPA